jgi:hypothetical protein
VRATKAPGWQKRCAADRTDGCDDSFVSKSLHRLLYSWGSLRSGGARTGSADTRFIIAKGLSRETLDLNRVLSRRPRARALAGIVAEHRDRSQARLRGLTGRLWWFYCCGGAQNLFLSRFWICARVSPEACVPANLLRYLVTDEPTQRDFHGYLDALLRNQVATPDACPCLIPY